MATPPSPDTIMLFKLLEDPEKWYGYYEIKNKIAEKVAPGRAVRKYKQRLKESRDLRGTAGVEIERTQGEMIRLGAMACAQVALTSWKGKGIMIRGEGQYKEIRIKPGFQSWGLVTAPEGGEDAAGGEQDPGKEAEGYTEVPPEAPEPSEALPQGPQSVSEPDAEVPAVVETGPLEVLHSEPDADMPTFTTDEVFGETASVEPDPAPAEAVTEEQAPGDLGPAANAASRWVTLSEVETCPDCGMGITDKAIHEDWHGQLRRVTAMSGSAFVDPETLRTLVEGVMRQALTRFQVNMQDWMETQFAELERQIRLGGKAEKVRRQWAEESPY
jgi:hypothetical protein